MAHTAGEAPPGCRSTAAAAAAFGPGAPSRELPINATGQSLAAIGYRRGWWQCPPGQRLQIRPQTDAKGGACDCALECGLRVHVLLPLHTTPLRLPCTCSRSGASAKPRKQQLHRLACLHYRGACGCSTRA